MTDATLNVVGIKIDPKPARKGGKQVENSLNKVSNTARNVRRALLAAFAGLSVGAIIREYAQFAQGLKNVATVAGATEIEFAALNKTAKELALGTRFDPTEVTKGMYSLASAGLAVNQIMATLPNVLNLAEAAQADLRTTTELTVSSMAQFGIEAEDSQRVVDVFTASIANSATNVKRLQVAMANSGAVANAYNQEFESSVAVLSILTTAFGNGEKAGTGYKTMITQLVKSQKNLGIEVINSAGEMKPLVDILDDLKATGMSTADIMQELGTEAGPALAILMTEGSEGVNKMRDSLLSTGQAAKTAKEQFDTLAGDIKGFRSAVAVAFVEIGEAVEGGLRPAIQALTKTLIVLIPHLATIIKTATFLASAKVIGLLITRFGSLSGIIGAATVRVIAFGTAVKAAALANPGLLALMGGYAAWKGITSLIEDRNERIKELKTLSDDAYESSTNLLEALSKNDQPTAIILANEALESQLETLTELEAKQRTMQRFTSSGSGQYSPQVITENEEYTETANAIGRAQMAVDAFRDAIELAKKDSGEFAQAVSDMGDAYQTAGGIIETFGLKLPGVISQQEKLVQITRDNNTAIDKWLESKDEELAKLKQQNEYYGLSKVQIIALEGAKKKGLDTDEKRSEMIDEITAALIKEQKALDDSSEAQESKNKQAEEALKLRKDYIALSQQYETKLERINRLTEDNAKIIAAELKAQNFSNAARKEAVKLLAKLDAEYKKVTGSTDDATIAADEMADRYDDLIDSYDDEIEILNAVGDAKIKLLAIQELERNDIDVTADKVAELIKKYNELIDAQQTSEQVSRSSGKIQGAFGSLFSGDFDGFISGFDSVLSDAADNFGDAITQGFQDGFADGGGISGGISGAASEGGGALGAVPVIGWIYAGMKLNDQLFQDGWRANDAEFEGFGELTGSATLVLDRALQALGLSERVASILSGSAIHARLFGRKAPEIENQGYEINTSGEGSTFADMVREGGFFRSDRRYTETGELSDETRQAFDAIFKVVETQLQGVAELFGTEMGGMVDATFKQIYDSEGELIESFSTFFGRVYKESAEQFASRLASESTIAYLDTMIEQIVGSLRPPDDLGDGGTGGGGLDIGGGLRDDSGKLAELIGQVSLAAEAYRYSSDALSEFTEAAVSMVHAMVEGDAIFEMFADNLAITEELGRAGETLNQTWSRLLIQNELLTEATGVMGIALDLTAEELTRFANDITGAAGGLPQAAQLWETYLTGFYSQQELTLHRLTGLNEDAARLNAELGTDLDFSTFREAFTAALPTLSPQEVVTWLRLGEALYGADQAANALADSSLAESISNFRGLADDLSDSYLTLYDRLLDNESAIYSMIVAYDGSIAAESEIADALANRYELELEYIEQIGRAAESISAMISGSIEDIQTSQMTDEEKYDYYSGQAEQRTASLQFMTDPDEIRRTVGEINQYQRSAYGLLSEDQQSEMADGFISFLDGVNTIAQDRLSELEAEATESSDRLLTQLERMFTENQTAEAENQKQFGDNVQKMQQAVVTFDQAVAALQNINVNVNVHQSQYEVGVA